MQQLRFPIHDLTTWASAAVCVTCLSRIPRLYHHAVSQTLSRWSSNVSFTAWSHILFRIHGVALSTLPRGFNRVYVFSNAIVHVLLCLNRHGVVSACISRICMCAWWMCFERASSRLSVVGVILGLGAANPRARVSVAGVGLPGAHYPRCVMERAASQRVIFLFPPFTGSTIISSRRLTFVRLSPSLSLSAGRHCRLVRGRQSVRAISGGSAQNTINNQFHFLGKIVEHLYSPHTVCQS